MKIERRTLNKTIPHTLQEFPELLQRIYLHRQITEMKELDYALTALPDFNSLTDINKACKILVDAIVHQEKILIIGDFDADGATSTALAIRALRSFGAVVDYIVPNRFEYGYGLTPEIVHLALTHSPKIIITVDNGISSHEGVALARSEGIKVVITDHHLPMETLPNANAIINPHQTGDNFPFKNLAGVGVCFYVMLALRSALKAIEWFDETRPVPNLSLLLDLVALGTVADVVPLDFLNRLLVHQGLERIRRRKTTVGILALCIVAKIQPEKISARDLGFFIGPRLNAAGRLEDMRLGIECLITDDKETASLHANALHTLNNERKVIENTMKLEAFKTLEAMQFQFQKLKRGICLTHPHFHQGVIGILAGRLKEQYHRPAIVFAPVEAGYLKGSARSITGIHMRDLLDLLAKRAPHIIQKFGGHAMAAGLQILPEHFEDFQNLFNAILTEYEEALFIETLLTDGELADTDLCLATIELLDSAGPFGQGFPAPCFEGIFTLIEQRIVGENHLKLLLQLSPEGKYIDAIFFGIDKNHYPNHRATRAKIAYTLDINEYNGIKKVQLMVEAMEYIS